MATVSSIPIAQEQVAGFRRDKKGLAAIAGSTAFALLLLGYHPAAEDGGIYAAALALRLDSSLFPAEPGFATAHTAHSLYVPLLAFCVGVLHLPTAAVLCLAYVVSVALTLLAARYLLTCLFPGQAVQHGALLIFAASLGLPIAGTSLYLVDPYLTARSFSTPLLILATAYLLQRRTAAFAVSLLACAALHPMMAASALPLFGAVLAWRSEKPWRKTFLLAVTVAVLMLVVLWFGPQDSPALRAASLSRDYWFPERWAPYEMLGLLAPPLLLVALARRAATTDFTGSARLLARATAISTTVTAVPAFVLIHRSAASLLLARLQPLRLLHLVYCVFLLLLASWVAPARGRWTRPVPWLVAMVAGGSLLGMQRQLYGNSSHFELPGRHSSNGYLQAFEWIRANTPRDALFALDAEYTTSPGEDANLFRAVSLRSSLPDAAKDGGISSVVPALAAHWTVASHAQSGLAWMNDAERVRRVSPFGATWIVLPAASSTAFTCPYRNGWAQVCRLP